MFERKKEKEDGENLAVSTNSVLMSVATVRGVKTCMTVISRKDRLIEKHRGA